MSIKTLGFLLLTFWIVLASACKGKTENTYENYQNEAVNSSENSISSENSARSEYCVRCLGTGIVLITSYPYSFKCTACDGTGVSEDERNNTNKPLYTCVYCNGTGKNDFNDEPCGVCRGYGVTLSSPQDQDRSMQNSQRNGSLCSACGGSGICPVCHGSDSNDMYGNDFCSSCGNTGKCKWCYGMGRTE